MKKHLKTILILVALALAAFGPALSKETTDWLIAKRLTVQGGGAEVDSNMIVAGPTDIGTATPGLMVQMRGVSNAVEVRNSSGTPIWSISNAGSVSSSGGSANNSNLLISAPTAIGTATPGLAVNNAGVSNSFEISKNGTPVFQMSNTGSISPSLVVAAPTAIGTATPVLMINSAGASNLAEFRKNGTPVFQMSNTGSISPSLVVAAPTAVGTATPVILAQGGASNLIEARNPSGTPVWQLGPAGAVTGLVLQYPTSGQKEVCGVTTITGTGTLATTLSTPVAVNLNLAQAATGNGYTVVYTNTAATVTAGVYGNQATPVAATTPMSVAWCAKGTP